MPHHRCFAGGLPRLLKTILPLLVCSALTPTETVLGGILTATLTASPSTLVNEQGTSNLTFNLTHTDYASGLGWGTYTDPWTYSGSYAWRNTGTYRTSGLGQIDSFSGVVYSGNAFGSSQSINMTVNGDSLSRTSLFFYDRPGTFRASVSGSAMVRDGRYKDNFYELWRQSLFGNWSLVTSAYDILPATDVVRSMSVNAAVDILVSNQNPTITQLVWDLDAFIGETVNFSVTGTDPFGAAPNEVIRFSYDFNNDGIFDDYTTSGGFVSIGATSFSTAGLHNVGVRMTDGLGGVALANFGVNVLEKKTEKPVVASVPEPATFSMWALGAVGLVFSRSRRWNAV